MPRPPVNMLAANRRRARGAGVYVSALASGARFAYDNRRVIQDATRRAKEMVNRALDRARRPKATGNKTTSSSVGQAYSGGNDWTVSKRTVGRRKKKPTVYRLNKLVRAAYNRQIYRFQNITNFDTNVGAIPIVNWKYQNGGVEIPVHVYNLTSFQNNSANAPGYRFTWATTANTSALTRLPLTGQNADGTANATGNWQYEVANGIANPNVNKFIHDWSDIRINFYGPRKRTTKFEVIFCRINDEFANPLYANVNNQSLKELIQYLERPCIYSNLQTSASTQKMYKSMKVVKRYTYWVSAGQTTDVDTSVGKIKEARIFMRHDRVYNLDFREIGETNMLPHEQADGLDFVSDQSSHNYPWYGSQLYMIIRAFAPERRENMPNVYPGTPDASIDPTYDILIRNAVSVST